jgi:hypothetical protein
MEVACGQCLGCRVDYSRMWAARIVHELGLYEHTGGNCFITLTYRSLAECTVEERYERLHVPDDWSLHKKHFQDFMKRLRHEFPDRKIKYFMCGEYGGTCKHGLDVDRVGCPCCNVGRPHYHAILFNCDFDDLESYAEQDGVVRWTSPRLERIWKYGFVDVGEANFDSAAYVAGYILKKKTGLMADDWYTAFDIDGNITYLTPEFTLMSRGRKKGEGIGGRWYERYSSDFFPSDENPVPGRGVFKSVPRYYEEMYKGENPEEMEKIKKLREEFRKEHINDYSADRLMDRYKVTKAKREIYAKRRS